MASSSPSDWKKMKVQELRDALATRGLDTAGLKAALIERMENSLNAPASGSELTTMETPPKQEEALQEKKGSQTLLAHQPKEAATEKVEILSQPPSSLPENNNGSPGEIKGTSNSLELGETHISSGTSHGGAGSTGPLTDLEKKRRRAERFGTDLQVSEEEKRRMRATRFGLAVQANEKSELEKRRARATRFGIPDEEAKKAARLERFRQELKQDDPLESEKRKARAARFGTATDESSLEAKLK